MVDMQLFLLGQPRFAVRGLPVEVRPRAVFELLALILLAGDEGIERSTASERLWGQLGERNARQQLRIALAKLRVLLSQWRLDNRFDLDSPRLRVLDQVEIDVQHIGNRALELRGLLEVAVPPCEGWKLEHWYDVHDSVGSDVAQLVGRYCDGRNSVANKLAVLRRAANAFPTTTAVHARLAAELRLAAREAELNECLIKFEEAWLDRFGPIGMPSIVPELLRPTLSRRRFLVTAVVAVAAITAVVAAQSWRTPGFVSVLPKISALAKFKSGKTSIYGRRLDFEGAENYDPQGLYELANGDYLLNFTDGRATFQLIVPQSAQPHWLHSYRDDEVLIDTDGVVSAFNRNHSPAIIDYGGTRYVLPVEPGFEWSSPVAVMRDHSVLIYRSSKDHSVSHHKYTVWKDGRETEVHIGDDMQVAYVSALSDSIVAGSYSKGEIDQWRFYGFVLDIGRPERQGFSSFHVAGILPDGLLVTRPFSGKPKPPYYLIPEDGRTIIVNAEGNALQRPGLSRSAQWDHVGVLGDNLLLQQEEQLIMLAPDGEHVPLQGLQEGKVGHCFFGSKGTALLYRDDSPSRDTIVLYLLTTNAFGEWPSPDAAAR